MLFSCNNNCKIDKRFSNIFYSQLEYLDNSQLNKRATYTKDVLGAIRFMMELTDTGVYLTYNDSWYASAEAYKKDRKVWIDWYNANKCTFTYSQLDSILNESNFFEYYDLEVEYPDSEMDFKEK